MNVQMIEAYGLAEWVLRKASISSMVCTQGGAVASEILGHSGGPRLQKALSATWALARIGIDRSMTPVQALDVAREFMMTMDDYQYQI